MTFSIRRLRALRRSAATVVALAVALSTTACGVMVPTDPNGTLQRIESSGELRAGATAAGEALVIDGSNVSGPLAGLVEGFAREHGATVEWVTASEETLVDGLEDGSLDVAVGGMTDATPWTDRVSVTRGFTGIEGSGGKALVVLVPLGENALQSTLEQYFDDEGAS